MRPIEAFRQKYPGAYDHIPDYQLAQALHRKYQHETGSSVTFDDFASQLGVGVRPTTVEPPATPSPAVTPPPQPPPGIQPPRVYGEQTPEVGRIPEVGPYFSPAEKQITYGTVAGNIPMRWRQQAGGMLQSGAGAEARAALGLAHEAEEAAQPGLRGMWGKMNLGVEVLKNAGGIQKILQRAFLPPEDQKKLRDLDKRLSKKGREIFDRASKDLEGRQLTKDDGLMKYYMGTALESGVGTMAPGFIASLITKSPNVGLTLMGGQVYGEKYAEEVDKGRRLDEASTIALFYAASETVTERIPFDILLKGGKGLKGVIKRVFGGALSEGGQEVVNEAMQAGFEAGYLQEDMTWGQAFERMVDAGIIGSIMGGGMGIGAEALERVHGKPKKPPPPPERSPGETSPPEEGPSPARVRELAAQGRVEALTEEDARKFAEQVESETAAAKKVEEGKRGIAPPEPEKPAKVGIEPTPTIEGAANEAATSPKNELPEPTEAQKESGTYKKGHVPRERTPGMDISIENPAGSKRRPEWGALKDHYGYIRETTGKDKDHLDVFIKKGIESPANFPVYVVDQVDPETGRFDEHKAVMGAKNDTEAREVYGRNYAKDWKGFGAMRRFTWEEFRDWSKNPDNTKQPASAVMRDLEASKGGIAPENPKEVIVKPLRSQKKAQKSAEVFDPRMKREDYRQEIQKRANDLVEGGGMGLVGGDFAEVNKQRARDKEMPVRALPSLNPSWFQTLAAETGLTVKQVKQAVNKALIGGKLGARQQRAVQTILDEIQAERDQNAADIRERRAREARERAFLDEEYEGLEAEDEALGEASVDAVEGGVPEDEVESIIERGALQGLSDDEITNQLREAQERIRTPGVGVAAEEPRAGAPAEEAEGAKQYPEAGPEVDGLTVRPDIPNQSSIEASLVDYETQPEVRSIPLADLEVHNTAGLFYAADDVRSVERLTEEIRKSGEVNPAIIVQDKDGIYILEGAHRIAALDALGKKEFPALVVKDLESLGEQEPLLTQPTPESLRARDEAEQSRAKAEQEAEKKAQADEEAKKPLTLTGSEREVDEREARGQKPLLSKGQPTRALTPSQVRQELVNEWNEKSVAALERLGITIVESPSDVPVEAPADAQGVYDPASGKSYLIAQNIGPGESVGVALHEFGTHAELSKLPQFAQIKAEMERMRRVKHKAVSAAYAKVPADTAKSRVTEEAIAYLAQDPANHRLPIVKRIFAAIRAWAFKRGFTRRLTPDAIVSIIQGSVRSAVRGETVQRGLPQMMKRQEGPAVGEPTGALTNRQAYSRKGQAEMAGQPLFSRRHNRAQAPHPDTLYGKTASGRVGGIAYPGQGNQWTVVLYRGATGQMFGGQVTRRTVLNRQFAINALQRMGLNVSQVPPGRTQAQAGPLFNNSFRQAEDSTFDWLRWEIQDKFLPLRREQEAIGRARGLTQLDESVDAYMAETLFHGRAADRIDQFKKNHVEPLMDEIARAKLTIEEVEDYLHARHAPEANARLKAINPTRPNNDALSGMSDGEAAQVLTDFQGRGLTAKLEAIARRVDAINEERMQILEREDLEKPQTIAKWRQTYDYYVPLNRDMGYETSMPARGRGYSIRGKESKIRAGSQRPVINILSNVVAHYEATVLRAEKNEVGKTLLKLVQQNPNPEIWETDKLEYTPTLDKQTGLIVYVPDPTKVDADHIVSVKVGGETHRITFNQTDPLAVRMALSLKNVGADSAGPIVRVLHPVSRYLSIVATSANPGFLVSNFARDIQTAMVNLSNTEAKNLAWKIAKDTMPALHGIRMAQKGNYQGQWAQHYREFTRAGGQTGWLQAYGNVQARERNLQRMLTMHSKTGKGMTMRFGKAMLDFVVDANTAVENAVRLSAYANARANGLSEKRAAQLAKELTVNFNRKGRHGQALNAAYLFFNASLQGTVRMMQNLTQSRRAQAIVGGIVVAHIMLDIVNRIMGGDDEDGIPYYDKIPSWVKARNWIFMRPDGKPPIMFPMPYGYNAFAFLGQKIGEAIPGLGKYDYSAMKAAGELLAEILATYNPIGSEDTIAQVISPTIADPWVQLAENKNFWGGPIGKEQNPFEVPKPEYQMFWNSTTTPSKWAAKQLNDLTGGTAVRPGAINVAPTTLDHLYNWLTGGVGRFLMNVVATPGEIRKALEGEQVETGRIPFLRRVLGRPTERYDRQAFYENLDRIDLAVEEHDYYQDRLREAKSKEEAAAVQREMSQIDPRHKAERFLAYTAKQARKQAADLNREIRRLREKGDDQSKGQIKRNEKRLSAIYKQFNREYNRQIVKGRRGLPALRLRPSSPTQPTRDAA